MVWLATVGSTIPIAIVYQNAQNTFTIYDQKKNDEDLHFR